MENETEIIKTQPKNTYASIWITQALCIAVLFIAIMVVKFFFANSYTKLQKWCEKNVLEQTVVSDVFDEEISREI